MKVTNHTSPLRRVLLVDAFASGPVGLLLLLDATALESLFGLPASLLRGVGLVLIPFAAFLLWIAPQASALRTIVRMIVGANALWVVASVLLLVSGLVDPTPLGTAFVALQAVVVAVLALVEHRALVRDEAISPGEPSPAVGR